MADIFHVLADTTRRDILLALCEHRETKEEMSVSDLVEAINMSQPTISKHLKILREAELVHVREAGAHRLYSLNTEPMLMVEDFLMKFLFDDIDAEISVEYVPIEDEGQKQNPERQEIMPSGVLAAAHTVGHTVGRGAHQVKQLVAKFRIGG